MEKHKFALTVQNRVISLKFSTHRVSKECTHHYALDQHSGLSEEPSKKASDRPKKHSHSHKRHDIEPRSTSDQYNDESDEPQISSSKSEKTC